MVFTFKKNCLIKYRKFKTKRVEKSKIYFEQVNMYIIYVNIYTKYIISKIIYFVYIFIVYIYIFIRMYGYDLC